MDKNKIALQLYSVRDDAKEDLYGTLKRVKAFGYTGVEFAGLHGHDPLEVKAMCQELGLVPISAHVPLDDLMADMEATIDCYKKIGVSYIVIPYLKEEDRYGSETFDKMMAFLPDPDAAVQQNYAAFRPLLGRIR